MNPEHLNRVLKLRNPFFTMHTFLIAGGNVITARRAQISENKSIHVEPVPVQIIGKSSVFLTTFELTEDDVRLAIQLNPQITSDVMIKQFVMKYFANKEENLIAEAKRFNVNYGGLYSEKILRVRKVFALRYLAAKTLIRAFFLPVYNQLIKIKVLSL